MASTGRILDIARRALSAQQTGLNVTGHNISNVNTPGYSRQRVVMEATKPTQTTWGFLGTGVGVQTVERLRDSFIDSELRSENQEFGRWTYRERVFNEIESLHNEPSDTGLSAVISDFWDSWNSLSIDPQSTSAREGVKQAGVHLANTFQHLTGSLNDIRDNLDRELENYVSEVNSLVHQIGDINDKIASTEGGSVIANDYRDRRDLLLEELNEVVDVNVKEDDKGVISLSMGGRVLLEKNVVSEWSYRKQTDGDRLYIEPVWAETNEPISITSGRVKGLIEMRDDVIGDQLDQLDELALGIAEAVNDAHRQGYGLDGGNNRDFFDMNETTGADDITLTNLILDDVRLIAASESGAAGEGNNALAISQLSTTKVLSSETATFTEFHAAMIGKLGIDAKEAGFMRENQELMINQLENQQSSISGVSLDEEMTNLIQYQHAYQAAARLVQTVDEVMETLVNMV